MLKNIYIFFISLIFIANSNTLGQDYSGKPNKIKKDFLTFLLQQTDSHLMLKVKDGQIYALDSKRNTIYPKGFKAKSDEVFYVFNVSELVELIKKKKSIKKKSYSKNKKEKDHLGNEGDDEDDFIELNRLSIIACPPTCD